MRLVASGKKSVFFFAKGFENPPQLENTRFQKSMSAHQTVEHHPKSNQKTNFLRWPNVVRCGVIEKQKSIIHFIKFFFPREKLFFLSTKSFCPENFSGFFAFFGGNFVWIGFV